MKLSGDIKTCLDKPYSRINLKVVLTSIGIVVGAATIVMVIAIGRGGQMDVADQFKNLNAGAIDISYEQSTDSSSSNSKGFFKIQAQQINHQEKIVSPKETRERPRRIWRRTGNAADARRFIGRRQSGEYHRCQEAV